MGLDTGLARTRNAARVLMTAGAKKKNSALLAIARTLEKRKEEILKANEKDIRHGRHLSQAMRDRLKVGPESIKGMISSLMQIAKLEDPVGRILEKRTLHNGLRLKKVSVPIGTIMIIYEARPNVTVDAAALCIKSGNAVVLRGGSDALHSNRALYRCIKEGLKSAGLPEDSVHFVDTKSRKKVEKLLKMNQYIDLVIPRGGEGLIRFVVENATMPVIMHYKGVCTVYVDKNADIDMAVRIVVNSKCQRPGVCNAAENLLVHESIAERVLPRIKGELEKKGVEIRGCQKTRKIIGAAKATEEDWSTEYLDLIISVKIVGSVEEAAGFINRYGSGHTEAIVTKSRRTAEKFMQLVDSSTIFWNASTRFTDGGQFGMGAEIGISTQKIHARGPMGLRELTTYKYLVEGTGQVRE